MMLVKRDKEPAPDPEQVLVGKCGTCGTVIEMPRRLAYKSNSTVQVTGQEPGVWNDLTYAECPYVVGRKTDGSVRICGARVFMVVKPAPVKIIQCQTTDRATPCQGEAKWLVSAGVVKSHKCCDGHKKLWESLHLEGFLAIPL